MANQSSNPILNRAIAGANSAVTSAGPAPAPTNEVLAATPAESKLAAVEAALGQQAQVVDTFVAGEGEAVLKAETLNDIMQSAMVDAAVATQTITAVEQNAAMKAQNNTVDAITALGGADAMVANMAQLDEEGQRLGDLLDRQTDIQNDEFTGIGIIDAVINEFRGASVAAQIESVTAERDNTARQIQLETAAAESANRQNILSKQTITNGTIKANSELIAQTAIVDVTKAGLDGIRSNSDRMRSLVSANQQQLANTVQTYRLGNEEANMQLSRERMVIQREQLAAQREMIPIQKAAAETALATAKLSLAKSAQLAPAEVAAREATLAKSVRDMETIIAAEDSMADQAMVGIAGMGLPEESREQVTVKLNNPTTRAKYIKLQELGSADKFQLADNAYDAQATRQALDPQGLASDNRGYELLDDVQHKVEAEVATMLAAGGKPPKTPEAQKDLFNQVAAATMKGHAASISEGNPLHAAPFAALVDNYAEISRAPLYQKVLAAANPATTSAKQFRKLGTAAVRAKLITAEEYVSGMEIIFDSAVVYNNESEGGFTRVGLPNQVNYNVQVPVTPSTTDQLLSVAKSVIFNPLQAASIAFSGSEEALAKAGKATTEALVASVKFANVDFTDSASIKMDLAKSMSELQVTEPDPAKAGTLTTNEAGTEGRQEIK